MMPIYDMAVRALPISVSRLDSGFGDISCVVVYEGNRAWDSIFTSIAAKLVK